MSSKRQIEDVLAEEGLFVSTTVGVSMFPMLRNRRDTIIVMPYEGRLKKYDVPLYKRGSDYILHRIIEVLPDSYVICGDNCIQKEYGITDKQILGVLTGFYRGSKQINMDGFGYKLYVRVWCRLYPIRKIYGRMRRIAVKVWRKVRRGKKDD
jgi:hypothetical protein